MKKTSSPGRAGSIVATVTRRNTFRDRENPLRGLGFERALQLIESYRSGEFTELQWTYSHLEESDPDLLAIADRRISSIVEMDWNIIAGPRKGGAHDQFLAGEQKAYLREAYDRVDNLYEAIAHLASATFRGFAHVELQSLRSRLNQIDHLEPVDQWNIVRDGFKGPWKYNPDATAASFASLPAERLIPEDQFLIRVVRRHVDRVGLLKAIRTNLAERDWTAFVEIYGIPSGVVTMPPSIPQGKERDFEDAAVQIAEGASGALPNGSSYTPVLTHDRQSAAPFRDHLAYLTRKLVLVGTGGLLTMLTQSGSGTLAGNAHSEAFRTLAKAEGRQISEIFQRTLDRHLLDREYPGRPKLAYFHLDTQTEACTSTSVDAISRLAAAGYRVSPAMVKERTGYHLAKTPELTYGAPEASNPSRHTAPPQKLACNQLQAAADHSRI
jgi:phage gp29-like protein